MSGSGASAGCVSRTLRTLREIPLDRFSRLLCGGRSARKVSWLVPRIGTASSHGAAGGSPAGVPAIPLTSVSWAGWWRAQVWSISGLRFTRKASHPSFHGRPNEAILMNEGLWNMIANGIGQIQLSSNPGPCVRNSVRLLWRCCR